MKRLGRVLGLVLILSLCGADEPSSKSLPRSRPEAQGVSTAGILAFVEKAEKSLDALHSVMVVRHGHVVAEGWWAPYNAESRHSLYSLSKSFTATAVGLAAAEGKLDINDRVLTFFADEAPSAPSDHLKSMRIRDLLRMSTGHQTQPTFDSKEAWSKQFLAHPVPNKPGAHFMYNTPATYMLSAIVQKTTGMTVLDYLTPRLFDPLGIEGATWGTSPQGVTLGGYGLSVRTEDIAKFGQLYLQEGKWRGKTLVPHEWVKSATGFQTSNGSDPKSDWEQGYGYQFWRCRHGAFRGDGAFGQFCLVMPEQDAVIAITSGLKDMQAVLNLVWDELLPAMKPAALPVDLHANETLTERLKNLSLPTLSGSEGQGAAPLVAGRVYRFPPNDLKLETVALEAADNDSDTQTTLVLRSNGADYRIPCRPKDWRKSRLAYGAEAEQPIAATGAWTTAETFEAKICFYKTPFLLGLRLKFTDHQVELDSRMGVSFGPNADKSLVGKSE